MTRSDLAIAAIILGFIALTGYVQYRWHTGCADACAPDSSSIVKTMDRGPVCMCSSADGTMRAGDFP